MSRRRPAGRPGERGAGTGRPPEARDAGATGSQTAVALTEAPPLSVRDPAMVTALVVAAACVLLSVSFRMDDPDLWQHLLVGKAIWRLGQIPQTHLWTWPSYSEREALPSWGFRALLWPFWAMGGVVGLYAWRWLTTLSAFALLVAAARTMGARGFVTLPVFVLCALSYRLRSQVRPETLVALLLALELWILERHRRAPEGRAVFGLVPIAWLWANVHISYYLGIALVAFHLADAWWRGRRDPRARRSMRGLALVGLSAVAVSFLNPFGWGALWQPFEFFLVWRHEPVFQTIIELHPILWGAHWKSGLPLVMLGWPLLALWRARREGLDLAELLTLALFSALALSTQRFVGLYALVAAPYLARDLDAWVRARRWPGWMAPRGARAALASVACVTVGILEWSRPEVPLGIALDATPYPVRACDFVESAGIRGHGFNPYHFGGYLLWRFWPDPGRLPFMDVHASGSREDRRLYAYSFGNVEAWRELDRKRHFDWIVLDGHQEAVRGDRLLDFLDADSVWALVFRDDAAALFVRRDGPLRTVAQRHGFRFVPAGDARVPALARATADPSVRAQVRREIERQIDSSPLHARALSLLATLDWIEGDRGAARARLQQALAVDPKAVGVHQRLGMIALSENRPADAAREFEAERALGYGVQGLEFLLGQAYQRAGDLARARAAYRRELALEPGNAAARDSLAAIEGAAGR